MSEVAPAVTEALTKVFRHKEKILEGILPAHVSKDRIVRQMYIAYDQVPKLATCSPLSVMNSVLRAAQLGVDFNNDLGHAWLLPRWNSRKSVMECQLQMGYKGLLDLAYRSPRIGTFAADVVHENDEFEYDLGTKVHISHKPCLKGDRGPWYAAYAIAFPADGKGQPWAFVMPRAEVLAIRDANAPKNRNGELVGPWKSHEDAMVRKTILKQVLKLAPVSVELAGAIGADDAIDAGEPPVGLLSETDFDGDERKLLVGCEVEIDRDGSKEKQAEVVRNRMLEAGASEEEAAKAAEGYLKKSRRKAATKPQALSPGAGSGEGQDGKAVGCGSSCSLSDFVDDDERKRVRTWLGEKHGAETVEEAEAWLAKSGMTPGRVIEAMLAWEAT